MKKPFFGLGIIAVLVFMLSYAARTPVVALQATEAAVPPAQNVSIKMQDGLEIKGAFFASTGSDKAPAILMLHQNEGNKEEWAPLFLPLTAAGYNVLAVDQRGFGETGGSRSFTNNVADANAMMAWLREQPTVDPDHVAVIGASVGANIALNVCATDDKCHAVIALSPGINFFGIQTKDAVASMKYKAILLVAAQLDNQSANPVKTLLFGAPSEATIMAKLYGAASSHGKDLLAFTDLKPIIMDWLDKYNKKA